MLIIGNIALFVVVVVLAAAATAQSRRRKRRANERQIHKPENKKKKVNKHKAIGALQHKIELNCSLLLWIFFFSVRSSPFISVAVCLLLPIYFFLFAVVFCSLTSSQSCEENYE